jgi:hypothetical protein
MQFSCARVRQIRTDSLRDGQGKGGRGTGGEANHAGRTAFSPAIKTWLLAHKCFTPIGSSWPNAELGGAVARRADEQADATGVHRTVHTLIPEQRRRPVVQAREGRFLAGRSDAIAGLVDQQCGI